MTAQSSRTLRRDAALNRERIVDAAERMFAEYGHDVALEEIARAAGVSRTTLYRNFLTREELAAVVYEKNVTSIEARASELAETDDGVRTLFDFVFDAQVKDRSLARMLSPKDVELFTSLSIRTALAFRPLVERGRRTGVTHAVVGVDDVMVAFAMSAGALADIGMSGRDDRVEKVRELLHRALFTSHRPH